MSGESTTTDLVELTRKQFEAVNRRDLDAVMSLCPPDGVYDTSHGLGTYEGPVAIRGFLEEWWGPSRSLGSNWRRFWISATEWCFLSFARTPVQLAALVTFEHVKRMSANG